MLLLPPQLRSAPTVPLDASQSRVADAVASGQSVVVTGAPGSGKTTTAVEIAVQALQGRADPGGILVIAATRRAASQLRDIISSRAGRTISAPPVRTIDSVAFSILRDQALALGQPPPRLINGPEQDHILAEILAAVTEGVGAPLCLPPELDPRALTTRGFRNELRDLFMRAAEHGVTPAQLEALSVQHHKPLWQVAAKLYSQYRAVLSLSSGGLDAGTRLDPAELVAVAARALRNWGPGAKPHFDLVIVDDYQEATAATAQLLTELHKDGAQLVLFGDPDVSVQAFRGAIPGLIGQAAQPSGASIGAFGLPEHVLEHVWRQPEELWAVTSRIAAKIPVLPGSPLRRKAATPDPEHLHAEPSACAITFGGKPQEAAWIAQQLRTEFLLNGTPWGQMAVIARSGAELSDLRRELILAGVPVALLGSDLPLQEEPAVAPLLQLLTLAVGHEPVTAEAVTGLLSSTLAGLDSIAQRRLRRSLRARELAEGGGRSSDELLVALVESVLVAEARGGAEAAWKQHWLSDQHVLGAAIEDGMARILKAIAAGKEAAAQPEQDVTTVLWAVWEAVALAEAWRATALVGGAAGAYADRNLDAVMAFFRRAEFFAERNPGAGVERFIADMMSQQFAADSVAAQGQDRGAVAALTPAGAAGRQWEVVVVAGVQEGTWPDLRLRDTVLGAGELADVMSGRLAAGESGIERGLAARAEVLADETRAFLVAVSRAYRRLIVTAVANQELNPSQFLHLVAEPVAYQPPASDLDVPFDLRGLVTAARIAVLSEGATATLAAELLAELWAAGVPGSDPDEWYGAN
ncbi:MAG: ATP-dependent helicase, partial [Cellulomonadaceae bacterium]|nr:ATP-dependent helicase [Cellulomonadaceae bacterium]